MGERGIDVPRRDGPGERAGGLRCEQDGRGRQIEPVGLAPGGLGQPEPRGENLEG